MSITSNHAIFDLDERIKKLEEQIAVLDTSLTLVRAENERLLSLLEDYKAQLQKLLYTK